MGARRAAPDARSRSHASYYVATVAIAALLALLCCYACYYFITKIKELSENDLPSATPSTSCPKKKEPISYPVQPVVRDSATAMAALCRQLPGGGAPQGDLVFPAGRSPDPRPAHALQDPVSADVSRAGTVEAPPKAPAPATATPCIALEAAS